MIERLKKLKEGSKQFLNGAELHKRLDEDMALRKEVAALSKAFLLKTVSGCRSCYFDTYIQLINYDMEKAIEKQACQFEMIRGKLLRDMVNLNVSLSMTQANITNELALYHLKTNPNCAKYFTKLPEDWKEQAANFKLNGEVEKEAPKEKILDETPKEPAKVKGTRRKVKEN